MGGVALYGGSTYQEDALAYVAAHILARARLGWFDPLDDVPLSVAAETGGPGDDLAIGFGSRLPLVEVQVKRGLKAGGALHEAVRGIAARLAAAPQAGTDAGPARVVLVVDPTASAGVRVQFRADLGRLRTGRRDGLSAVTRDLLAATPGIEAVLPQLWVVPLDVESPAAADRKAALTLLARVLTDAARVHDAWHVLSDDAGVVCRDRLRRTRPDLEALLTGAGHSFRPPEVDATWHRQLDAAKGLLERDRVAAALELLRQIERELAGPSAVVVGADVRFRLALNTSVAWYLSDAADQAETAARRALDVRPNDPKALHTLAVALLAQGEVDGARRAADRIIADDPSSVAGWSVRALIAADTGEPAAPPPSDVAADPEYLVRLLNLAAQRGAWREVLERSAVELRDGRRGVSILLARATALTYVAGRHAPGASSDAEAERAAREQWTEADRLATEVLDAVADEGSAAYRQALAARADARQRLGREADSAADRERLRALAPDDPNAIQSTAVALRHGGDAAGALDVLRHPTVEQFALLLVLRAEVRAELGDGAGARADLSGALARAADGGDDRARIAAALAAADLGEVALAEQALAAVSEPARRGIYDVAQGRLAFRAGDVAAGVAAFHRAAEALTELQGAPRGREAIGELASRLRAAGRPREAADELAAIGAADREEEFGREYLVALIGAHDYMRAQEVLDAWAARGELPEWAYAHAADLAHRRDDLPTAIAHLERLATLGRASVQGRLALARFLTEVGRGQDAMAHVDAVLARADASPRDRMHAAEILARTPDAARAIPVGVRALREAPTDPAFHRALIGLSLRAPDPAPSPDVVGADTWVRLEPEDGVRRHKPREMFIFAEPPADPLRGEVLAGDAQVADLLGRRVGDRVTRQTGWGAETYRIAEIVATDVAVVRDAMVHFEDRFPGQQFLWGFQLESPGGEFTVRDWAPLIASTLARQRRVRAAVQLQREHVLPIEFVAGQIGATVRDFMLLLSEPADGEADVASSEDDAPDSEDGPAVGDGSEGASESPSASGGRAEGDRPTHGIIDPHRLAARRAAARRGLLVEWSDADGQRTSQHVALTAPRVVLTRAALHTASRLDILDTLAAPAAGATSPRELFVPHAVVQQLTEEHGALAEVAERGRMTLGAAEHGLRAEILEPGVATPAAAAAADLLAWVRQHTLVEYRPLATVGAPGSTAESWRGTLGHGSADALALAHHCDAALYADDLGLRRAAQAGAWDGRERGRRIPSFSTVTLLPALAAQGVLGADARDRHLLALVGWRYEDVRATPELLGAALRAGEGLGNAHARLLFALLAADGVSLVEAAGVVAAVVRAVAVAAVRPVSVEFVLQLTFDALSTRWTTAVVAAALARVVGRAVRLMPEVADEVRTVCAQYARGSDA